MWGNFSNAIGYSRQKFPICETFKCLLQPGLSLGKGDLRCIEPRNQYQRTPIYWFNADVWFKTLIEAGGSRVSAQFRELVNSKDLLSMRYQGRAGQLFLFKHFLHKPPILVDRQVCHRFFKHSLGSDICSCRRTRPFQSCSPGCRKVH